MRLQRSFFLRPTLTVARELLGKFLVYNVGREKLVGEINEVESYIGTDDPACHAARGKTKRNEIMFSQGGHAYIYFTYGMYYCLNVVTEKKGFPAAVLIRSVIPKEGIEIMQKNRQKLETRSENTHRPGLNNLSLTNGPGKLCVAYGLTTSQNGTDLITSKTLYIEDRGVKIKKYNRTSRIGIRAGTEKLWRFHYHS